MPQTVSRNLKDNLVKDNLVCSVIDNWYTMYMYEVWSYGSPTACDTISTVLSLQHDEGFISKVHQAYQLSLAEKKL